MKTGVSKVYTDRPDYADFDSPAKFEAIKSIIAKRLYEHPNAICSYSGGADSDIMIDLIERTRKTFGFPPIKYVFFNTGLEMKATKDHVKHVAEYYGVEIEEVRPKINIVQSTRKYGIPFVSKIMSGGLSDWQKKGVPLSIAQEYDQAEDKEAKRKELKERYPKCESLINFLCCCNSKGEPRPNIQLVINSSKYMRDFIEEYPPDFMISAKCCDYCKKQIAHKVQKDYDMIITGERRDEGGMRSVPRKDNTALCFTETASGQYRLRPLYYVSDKDKEWYKNYYGIKYSDAYEVYGLTRTGCCGYKECGIQKYRYLATLDLKTCTRCCRPLDGKTFNIKDKQIGVNCPPMHPWCRCTITSVVDEEYLKQMKRIARDPATGKNMKVPATMTYEEWYKKYVEGKPEAKLEEKKLKNKRTDRKQYDEHKKVIGKYAGKTLDDFQNMKYNEPEKWEDIKAYKKYAIEHPGSDKKDYNVQKAIKEAGIKGIAKIKPEKMDVSEYTYDEKHINSEREHSVSRDEAERFIKESDISLTRWNGRFVNYYSKNGATYVDVENKNIRTAFTRKEFDKNTLKIREVAEKYATKKSRVSDSKKED